MKSARVEQAKGLFKLIDEKILEPARGQVRIKVQACGVCHSDSLTKEGAWPGIAYPRSPGHEIAGVIDALGDDTDDWKVGDRVGVGWHGGHCGTRCDPCRRGDFIDCRFLQIPGISYDGGYVARHRAAVPERIERGDTGAHQRRGLFGTQRIRNMREHGGGRDHMGSAR